MRYAIIEDNIVVNVVEAGEDFDFGDTKAVATNVAGPGWIFHHGINTFSPPVAPPAPVPESVTPLQMRKALRSAGLKDQADTYLATLGEEEQEAWEYANSIERSNAFIEGARQALGMTNDEADNLFRLAATL